MQTAILLFCLFIVKKCLEPITAVKVKHLWRIDSINNQISETNLTGFGRYPYLYKIQELISYMLVAKTIKYSQLPDERCGIE